MSEAGPGEVLVSSMIKDLFPGRDSRSPTFGIHQSKGSKVNGTSTLAHDHHALAIEPITDRAGEREQDEVESQIAEPVRA